LGVLSTVKRITSRQNAVVARYKAAARGDDSALLLDGWHLVREALNAGLEFQHVLIDAALLARPDVTRLAGQLQQQGVEIAASTPAVIAAASPVRSPSGIVALISRPTDRRDQLFRPPAPLVVVGCGLQDPGNMGALVRVSEAAGATGCVAVGSADPFGWKALRGSSGSALRLPIVVSASAEEAIADARAHRCRVIATVPRSGSVLFDSDLRGPLAVLIGGEGAGLPESIIDHADERVTIPMEAPVESLNAAVTTGVILYEAHRQRRAARSG